MSKFGALKKFFEAVKSGLVPMDETRDIGRRFDAVPPEIYHNRAKYPARTREEAEEQYGLRIFDDEGEIVLQDKEGPAFFSVTTGYRPREGAHYAETAQKNLLSGADELINFVDALGSEQGTGFGKRAYGAIYDLVPGLHATAGLTPINTVRRSMSMADAIHRNPRLANKLIPSETQLVDLNMSPTSYMLGADYNQKLGSLLLGGAGRQEHYYPGQYTPGTLRRAEILEELLKGRNVEDEAFRNLGYKRGGQVTSRKSCGPLSMLSSAG